MYQYYSNKQVYFKIIHIQVVHSIDLPSILCLFVPLVKPLISASGIDFSFVMSVFVIAAIMPALVQGQSFPML